MDYITIHQETGLLICKDCKFALIPSRINRHFSISPHRLNPQIRSQIENYIAHINHDNLVTYDHEIKPRIQTFLESFDQSSFISKLAIYSDGLACPNCSYISRSINPIQTHLKEYHDWENPRIRGRKKKSNENDPWNINVSCQQFFRSGLGSEYFRVNSNRASPISVPIRPRIEISREEESNSSESENNQDDSLSRSISQSKLINTFY